MEPQPEPNGSTPKQLVTVPSACTSGLTDQDGQRACPICFTDDLVAPQMLGCGHRYCAMCIATHASVQRAANRPVNCPCCLRPVEPTEAWGYQYAKAAVTATTEAWGYQYAKAAVTATSREAAALLQLEQRAFKLAAEARRQRQGGPPRPELQIQVDTEEEDTEESEEDEEGAPQRSLSPHQQLACFMARLRAAGPLTEADPPTMARPDAAPRHPSPPCVPSMLSPASPASPVPRSPAEKDKPTRQHGARRQVGKLTAQSNLFLAADAASKGRGNPWESAQGGGNPWESPQAVGATTPAYARRQAARTRWRQLRAAQRIVAWYHGRLEAPERCAVCLEALYEAHVERDAVRCGDGHLVCRCCLPRIVTASAARAPLNLSAEEQWSGRYLVRCPLHGHGCSAAALPLTRLAAVLARAPDGEGEAAFAALLDAQLRLTAEHARLAPPPPTTVVDGAPSTPGQPQTAAAAAAAARPARWVRGLAHAGGRALAQPAEAIERRREAKALRRAAAVRQAEEFILAKRRQRAAAEVQRVESLQALQAALREGDGSFLAYECPRCGCGPITHVACENLRTHHRESRDRWGRGRISNACPHCGWFSANISNWPRWTGERVGPSPSRRTAAHRALKKKRWGR